MECTCRLPSSQARRSRCTSAFSRSPALGIRRAFRRRLTPIVRSSGKCRFHRERSWVLLWLERGIVYGRHLKPQLLRRSLLPRLLLAIAGVLAADELEVLDDYRKPAPLHASLVVPLLEPQMPFDHQRLAFGHVLTECFGLTTERAAVNEADFFLLLAVLRTPLAVNRHPEFAYRRIAREH